MVQLASDASWSCRGPLCIWHTCKLTQSAADLKSAIIGSDLLPAELIRPFKSVRSRLDCSASVESCAVIYWVFASSAFPIFWGLDLVDAPCLNSNANATAANARAAPATACSDTHWELDWPELHCLAQPHMRAGFHSWTSFIRGRCSPACCCPSMHAKLHRLEIQLVAQAEGHCSYSLPC